MALSVGERLGSFEILELIGAGGMGEVYRARDHKLDRDVAIKILPDTLMHDPERLARFEREAKVLASLNHPNIAQIYAVEQGGLVMELVEGETLRGPLPIETALKYAKQIAEALEAAHEKGIIHRDLKLANVMVTPHGVVKVLDFGLAKAGEGSTSSNDVANSPTLTMSPTRSGTILGTASYMAPEQARGQVVDRRADIWAFGCVLYELTTGKHAFPGESVADILSAVLKTEPDLNLIPARVRKLVTRCLTKDRKQRLQAIGDARIEIDEALSGAPQETEPVVVTARQRRNLLPWGLAAVLAVFAVSAAWTAWRATRPMDRPLMRLSVDLGPDAVAGQFTTTTISPDGTRLIFPAKSAANTQMLATELLNEAKPVLLLGTENGRDPFFSPDGQSIGFFADGRMKRVSVSGGAPVVLCDAPSTRGANWSADGSIIVALNATGELYRVAAEGGAPEAVTKLQGALTHRWPQTLPGNGNVLFTLSTSSVSFENASIATVSLKTGETKILVRGGYFGRYLPTGDSVGHLVYVHEGVLFAVPFDSSSLELRGVAVPILENLAGDPASGAGQFSFSGNGNIAYRTGKVSAQSWPVLWLDDAGRTRPLIAHPSFYLTPRFSPDGQRLALLQIENNKFGIFVYDWQRDTLSRVGFDTEQTSYPTWSPDGKHLVVRFNSGLGLGWMRADGAGETQSLLDSKSQVSPYSFFPDGKRLAFMEIGPDGTYDLWTLALDVNNPDHPRPREPELFLRTSANERYPAVSPDGRWIAYTSDESGRYEVYVRPFPGPGGKWQISSGGGTLPIWSHSGRELFFESPDSHIIVTDYDGEKESFVSGKPRLWSNQQLRDISGVLNYDLAPDGKRFAIFPELKASIEEKGSIHVSFLENFFDELRRRAPVTK